MVSQTPATMRRVVMAFSLTAVVAVAPMAMLLMSQWSGPFAGAVADSGYGESALMAVLIVASLATVAVATVVVITARRLPRGAPAADPTHG